MEVKVRTIEWTPACFMREAAPAKGDKPAVEEKALYEGSLTVRVPLSEDRCQVLVDLGIMDMSEDSAASQSKSANAKMLMTVWKQTKNLLVSAKVKRISDGKELDLEDVLHEQGLFAVPFQFAEKFINGFGPGNG